MTDTRLFDRRSVLAGVGAAGVLPGIARARPAGNRVFVASGWIPGSDAHGIYSAPFDAVNGVMGPLIQRADAANPIYITLSPNGRLLYAGMSTAPTGSNGQVLTFAVDGLALRPIGAMDAAGRGSRDPRPTADGRHILHVNYETAEVVSSRLTADGIVGETISVVREAGSGPVRPRQLMAHPHCVRLAPGGNFAVVSDLGADQHFVYRFNPLSGQLESHGGEPAPTGSGPKHLEFHAGGRWLYSTNELAGGLNVLSWREDRGILRRVDTLATVPPSFAGKNTTSDLALHPTGNYLYVSNRGHGSIAVFAIDPATGVLTLRANRESPDDYPWTISLHPSGRWLFVSCRTAGAVAVLPVDPTTGLLGPETSRVNMANPAAIRCI